MRRFLELAKKDSGLKDVGLVAWTAFLMDRLEGDFLIFYKMYMLGLQKESFTVKDARLHLPPLFHLV